MSDGLEIAAAGALDFVALGALVHRIDPGIVPFRKATECHIHVSGGEFNTAANLADCFRLQTGIVTAMVDYPIGELVAERVRAMGVKPFYKRFQHNGVNGPNIAAVYSDRGHGVRAPVVFYNRCNEAAAQLKEKPYVTAGNGGMTIMKDAPHPNATRVYVDWLLSAEGQGLWAKSTGTPSYRQDASHEGVFDVMVPKPGVEYFETQKEDFARHQSEAGTYIKTLLGT